MPITERIQNIMDTGFTYTPLTLPPDDPIDFMGPKSYKAKLKEARDKCPFQEAFSIVTGTIDSMPLVSMFMDFDFIGGSMGIAVGDAIVQTCSIAIKRHIPAIIFSSSGGARMQEGIFSLMQMPRTVVHVERVKKSGLPFISVLTHPTTGGVLASFAMRGSVTLAEPDATIAFTGPRVIKDTLGIDLPPGFQSSQAAYSRGFIDQIVQRNELKGKIAQLLRIYNL
jgi:acetyl-CoA carboxylase carboxyl transferase subunit beta